MLSLAATQSEIMAAVCDVRLPVPDCVEAGRDEAHRVERFNIYRNNFYVAVINVLKDRFPVTERLVGEDFFRTTARAFVEQSPPRGQINLHYGGTFSDYLETFEPVSDIAYLPDVARLEWARFECAIAPDALVVTSDDFGRIDPELASLTRLRLHPSHRLVSSKFPIYDIWKTNHEDDEVRSLRHCRDGQSVLIARSSMGVETHQLPDGGVTAISALANGATLSDAFEAAGQSLSEPLSKRDFSTTLAALLSSGAVSAVQVPNRLGADIQHCEI